MVVPKNPRLREETPQPTRDATSPSMSCACDVRGPRKSHHSADARADVIVDALNSEASRKTCRPSEPKTSVRELYVTAS
jgi:hypothetical protein